LFLRYLAPTRRDLATGIVLYVHGATFPSALSIAHRFDGRSWRDELNDAGFHVWGLDFLGFGESDRYLEMQQAPDGTSALGRAEETSRQIERAVQFIVQFHQVQRLSIIAHSWGTMPTGLFAARHPESVSRLVFFAPVVRRAGEAEIPHYPAWRLVSLAEQWTRFVKDVPANRPPVLSRGHFDDWGARYLATDPESESRSPAAVKVPTGPVQEIAEAFAGQLAYNPQLIQAPVAIIRGAWDSLVTDADAAWLFDALTNAAMVRDVKISRGTHLLHLEQQRYALYRETETFLRGRDEPVLNSNLNDSPGGLIANTIV
jgi:pimeloyl-ACP methyl ester carboxylesterase